MRDASLCTLLLAGLTRVAASGPHVAYVGNVPVHGTGTATRIMVADVAGGPPTNVSEGLHAACSPAWSPDGARLVFAATEERLSDVFVCRPDGADRVNVTASAEEWESGPVFVGADRVAYLAGPDRADVWVADLRTGAKTQLTDEPRFYQRPAASPDGALLAVTGADELAGPGDIFLIPTDGEGLSNLTGVPAIYSVPCFSPDGRSIAFAFDGRDIGGASRGVALMPVDGGEPRLLATDGYPFAPLSWSSDGSRIAYTSASHYHTTWVNVADVEAAGSVRLETAHFHIIGWPSFSPDGKTVAHQGVYAARFWIHLVNLETGETRRLTPEGETGVNPVFSPR